MRTLVFGVFAFIVGSMLVGAVRDVLHAFTQALTVGLP